MIIVPIDIAPSIRTSPLQTILLSDNIPSMKKFPLPKTVLSTEISLRFIIYIPLIETVPVMNCIIHSTAIYSQFSVRGYSVALSSNQQKSSWDTDWNFR